MRKALLTTVSVGAMLAAGPVLAADMVSVGIGGFMEQWFGVSSIDDTGNPTHEGGASQYSDSEIIFKGSLEADNGLTFSVKVELEANSSEGKEATPRGDQIDESQLTVGGEFGQLVLGSEDHPASLMHYGNQDVGVGISCGDVGFITGATECALGGKGFGTAGHLIGGDDQKIAYYTPRMEGVQFGLSYIPDTRSEDGIDEDGGYGKPKHNDNDAWSVGLNYMGDFGGATLGLSFGHYQAAQTVTDPIFSTRANANLGTVASLRGTAIPATLTTPAVTAHAVASDNIKEERDPEANGNSTAMMKVDEETFTNAGIRVGFGAFSFDVAYAVHDGGAYATEVYAVRPEGTTTGAASVRQNQFDAENEDEEKLYDSYLVRERIVKAAAHDYEVVSVGAKFTQGPLAVSLGHIMTDADDGTDGNATALSAAYTLAPGVVWKSTLMAAERSDIKTPRTATEAVHTIDGTAFVTGFRIDF